jgi:exodeoxyribonuclease III
VKIATWNVNSIRARHDRVVAWLAAEQPDVLCMQEIKVEAQGFPRESIEAAGYHCVLIGQRTYNGVAIASREPMTDVVLGLGDGVADDEARFILGSFRGVRIASIYVPNGGGGPDRFSYKLEWLARLRRWLDAHADPAAPLALCGDFNVAPEDRDIPRSGRARSCARPRSAPRSPTSAPGASTTSSAATTRSRASSPGGTTAASPSSRTRACASITCGRRRPSPRARPRARSIAPPARARTRATTRR